MVSSANRHGSWIMSLISLFAALFIEQFRPLDYARWVADPVRSLAVFVEEHLDAGDARQGWGAWAVIVVGSTALVAAMFFGLLAFNWFAAVVFNVFVLYLTMGFRQFSHHFTQIHLALRMGEIDRARTLLADWRGESRELWSSSEIARLAIEHSLLASHRHVFGVLVWFVLLPGPSGPVLYRLSALLAEYWGNASVQRTAQSESFGRFARQVFALIDWLPQRVTAMVFAIVGNFEDAVHCWRTQAGTWSDPLAGIVLASGAGALGVRLGMPVPANGGVEERSHLGVDVDADVDFMQSAIGLVWRALVFWLLLILVLASFVR